MLNQDCPTGDFDLVVSQLDTSFCHVPGAICNPWGYRNTGKGNVCEALPKDIALDGSEKSFIAGFVSHLANALPSKDNAGIEYTHKGVAYTVYLYRNPSNTGINLRYDSYPNYYPDFVFYFLRKDSQEQKSGYALFIDPKGLATEFAREKLRHYKYLASTITIEEINQCVGQVKYVAAFASTSKMEQLGFLIPEQFNLDEQTRIERFARMGIFFNDKMDYEKLIDWALDDGRFLTQLVKKMQQGINTDIHKQTDQNGFSGGYIGLLARALISLGKSEADVYSIIFTESFKHDSLVNFNDYLAKWSETERCIDASTGNTDWRKLIPNKSVMGFTAIDEQYKFDRLIEWLESNQIHRQENVNSHPVVAHSTRAVDSAT